MTPMHKFLKKKVTRRKFIKGAVAGIAGISAAGLALKFLKKPVIMSEHSIEAFDYVKSGKIVQCKLCPNGCAISPSQRGTCQVRENQNGKLYSMVYGNPCAVHTDPIEKKPLYHFLPTSKSYSIATAGCNFTCLNCQNWQISQYPPEKTANVEMMPSTVVDNAIKNGAKSIAYTYGEPTVFYEYMHDTAKIANSQNIKNVWVTNGYMNKKPLVRLSKYLDAANVDVKGFDERTYKKLNSGSLKPVLNTLKTLKEQGVWFEITNLIVPGYTDDDEIRQMSQWFVKNLGSEYPVHFSRFVPMFKLSHLSPTPLNVLEQARKIAVDEGLKHVYIGNVPGTKHQSTYCSKGHVCIERKGYSVKLNIDSEGHCKQCGEKIAGRW